MSHDFDLGQYTTSIRFDATGDELLLVASADVGLEIPAASSATLGDRERSRLESEARRIWAREISRLPSTDRPGAEIALGEPRVLGVPGFTGLRTVVVPATFSRYGSDDSRGSFFFLLDGKGKFRLARFGHPEWSPDSSPTVVQILPALFFRAGSGSKTYLLVECTRGWESDAIGVLDPGSARIVATTDWR